MPKRSAKSARPPKKRAQGRPTDAADAVGPEVLLQAARELLERLPPSKVTRAAVARQAGVDPSLIRYYFRDRESLLLAVIERTAAQHAATITAPPKATAAEKLRSHVRDFFEFNAANPFFGRLLIEELATSSSPHARAAFHELNQRTVSFFADTFREGARDKTLRRVDPALMHIAVAGMSEFFLGSRVVLESAFGKGATPATHAKRYAELLSNLIIDGLRPR